MYRLRARALLLWRRARFLGAERGSTVAERGSAVAEFVLVSSLAILVMLAVFQIALALHIRITLIDCAGQGARTGALLGADPALAAQSTEQLIASAVHTDYARDVQTSQVTRGGVELLEVSVRAPLPLIGLIGPTSGLSVSAHAVIEEEP